jgi:hypothetical protein
MKLFLLISVASVLPRSVWAANVQQQPLGHHFTDAHGDSLLQNDELDRYIEDVIVEWHCPGMAVSIVRGNDTWAKVGYVLFSSIKVPVL